MSRCLPLCLAVFSLALAACTAPGSTTAPTPVVATLASPTPTAEPTEAPAAATATEPPATPAPTFEAALYRDEFAGFELDYPADWTLDDVGGPLGAAVKQAERGYYAQLTSWPHAPGEIAEEMPPGGSRLDITVQQWDPADDLAAHLEMRKTAWSSSGMTILSEETWTLAGDGGPLGAAVRVIVQTVEGEQAFFLITTTANGRYLVLSGTGDLGLLQAIGRTVRVAAQS